MGNRFASCSRLGEKSKAKGEWSAVCVGVSRSSSHRIVRGIKTSDLSSAKAGSTLSLVPSWVLHLFCVFIFV